MSKTTLPIFYLLFQFLISNLTAKDQITQTNVTLKSTINCIGIKIDLEGDQNLNAKGQISFKKTSADKWEKGLDLFRINYDWKISEMNSKGRKVNTLAGSIFRLSPGTEYEIKITISDPDGGSFENIYKAKTNYPIAPSSTPKKIKPGELEKAINEAKPGDILLLEKGNHGKDFTINVSGAQDKYIFITGEGKHEAKIEGGFKVEGSFIWIDNIHIQQPKVEFPTRGKKGVTGSANSSNLVVTRCLIENVLYGVHTYGHTCIATDNKIIGDKPEWTPMDQIYKHPIPERRKGQLGGEGVDFGHHKGGQFVAAFNDISLVADGVSYGDNNTDVYNNEIYLITDDQIEPDYAYDNYRVWNNRGRTGLTGLSFQPFNGGPWYFFRNQISGNGSYVFKIKDNDGRGPSIFLNNTFIQTRAYFRNHVIMLSGGMWVNNIWGNLLGGNVGSSYEDFENHKTLKMSNNAYHSGDKPYFHIKRTPITLESVQKTNLEKNSKKVNLYKECQNLSEDIKERDPGTSKPLYLKDNSSLIDAGEFITNISLPFKGKAPDIGVYEKGMGFGWYGPRQYTKDGFTYGIMENWTIEEQNKEVPQKMSLTLVNKTTNARISVYFKSLVGSERDKEITSFFPTKSTEDIYRFSDSILAYDQAKENSHLFYATQLEIDGLWLIEGSCDLKTSETSQNDFYTFIASIQKTCLIRIKKE